MKGHDLINSYLPDELIIEIFRHMHSKSSRDACALVCKRWLALERTSRRTLRIGASGSPDSFVKLLARRFVNVKNLYVDERLSVSHPVQLGRRRGGSQSTLSSLKLHYMIERGESDDSELESNCFSDAGLIALGETFTKLKKLSLIWCSNVTSMGLQSFAQKCRSLRSLDLQGCYVGDQGLAAVGECCKELQDLNLRFCEGLTDRGLVELAIGCGKSLKVLGIAACAKITDISLEAVGSHCRSLETLSLDSEFIHNEGVLAVAEGCRLLKVLKLLCINVTDEALEAVGTCCLSLEVLALYSFQKFTDRSLSAIGNGCKKLKNLILSDCYFLSDKGLEAIATGCSELIHLEVNGCHNIGTLGLASVGKSCLRLTELALLYCQRIGDNALLEIGRGCKFLQALHLVDCSSIGDDAICGIANGCRNLKKLHIRRCYENLGDMAMAEIGEGCPSLKDIVLSHCRQITDVGLAHLVKKCTMLETCHMVYCPGITTAGVATVVSTCANIKKVLVEKSKVSERTRRRAGSVISYICVDLSIPH
ncbi:hypothetical protein PVL29_005822 [Vitis rotundifolia]|uniref:F-box/LRR-repeat protein 4 n=1 Tax=Vitis rotundifolia TaxID=103349 RepID=A0AA39A488_VITRO|nr:hypothetical protein PVL29_005822 [Vitis rotundifolia]